MKCGLGSQCEPLHGLELLGILVMGIVLYWAYIAFKGKVRI